MQKFILIISLLTASCCMVAADGADYYVQARNAIALCNWQEVDVLINENKINKKALQTLFESVVEQGDLNAVEKLFARGVDPNGKKAPSPLHIASKLYFEGKQDMKITKFLLSHGADPDVLVPVEASDGVYEFFNLIDVIVAVQTDYPQREHKLRTAFAQCYIPE